MTHPTLNHFAHFRFTREHRALAANERTSLHERWVQDLRAAASRVEIYQVFPARHGVDVLIWSAMEVGSPDVPATFFGAFARAMAPMGLYVEAVDCLWGMTRPSPYVPGKKPRGIDCLEGQRQTYLTVYPFVKTAGWYAMSREARQGMMNEHIKIGREFPEVDQLLLYSFGLQDQEFVVVYEMEDLARYSQLVNDLRSTEGRRFTERDTPITTAIYRPADETLALWN